MHQDILNKTHPDNEKLVIPVIGGAAWKFHILKEMLDKHYKNTKKLGSTPIFGVYEFEGREVEIRYYPRPHLVKRFVEGKIPGELMTPEVDNSEE